MNKKVLMLGLMAAAFVNAHAIDNRWPLDTLRARAVSNNKSLLMAEQNKVAAHYTHKPKSVIRISLCRTAKRNPLIFPI